VHVLRNPAGGGSRSRRRATKLVGELAARGHDVVDLTGTTANESSENLGRAVEAGEVDRIVLAGGDGLVHLAIQHLATTTIAVTLAPLGTGNDFANALGITGKGELVIDTTASPVDLIEVVSNGAHVRWVASIAIAGFPAAINRRANDLSPRLGAQVYTVAAALELPRFQRQQLSLRLDGVAIETDTAMLAIGNTKLFGGGMLACPDALPNDGLVHLTSIQGVGRIGILRHLVGRTGGTADRPEVLRRTAKRIDLDTPYIDIWADGEPVSVSPQSFHVRSSALHVTSITMQAQVSPGYS
jgi:diacylglycerol kinase (ATP)